MITIQEKSAQERARIKSSRKKKKKKKQKKE
jgi:hypothetical protein